MRASLASAMSDIDLAGEAVSTPITCLEDLPAARLLGRKNRFLNAYFRPLAMAPFILVLIVVFWIFPHSSVRAQMLLGTPALIWAIAVPIYALIIKGRLLRFRCPRCGAPFGLDDTCGSCGLPRLPVAKPDIEDPLGLA